MGLVSTIAELDLHLKSELDPFEDMCGPKSQNTISSYKMQTGTKAPKSPVKRVLMLRPPTSQTLSDIAALQKEKAQLSQQMKQMEAWVKNAESRHGSLIKANRHMRLMLEKADKELEMSRLKQDKLSDMLAAADATKQAAEQRSRRLEIKFARSDKGHALMQSAKLQASATEASKQVAQLQNDLQHKGQLLASSQAKVVELHRSLMHHARLTGIQDQELLISNSNLTQELNTSKDDCARYAEQLHTLQQQLSLSQDAEAKAAKLQEHNAALLQQVRELEKRTAAAVQQPEQMQQQYHEELAVMQSRLQAEADRGADELVESRREFDERMTAIRAQLEQQEVDNAALLDVVQDLEDRQTPEALEAAQTKLAAAHDQQQQLQQQLQQAQSDAVELSSVKTQLILLQSQLHQQRDLCQQQTVAAEALTAGIDRERNSWQVEHQTLRARSQAAESEVARLQQSVQDLKSDNQKAAGEAHKSSQQWAVTQADLRSTRHQLKVLRQQNASLQPAPTADATQQQDASALQTRVDQLLIELDSKTQEVRNVSHARAILASELELASGVQIKGEARLQAELEELREDLDTKSQVVTALQAELGAKADELQDARTELEAVLRSSVDKQATESGLLVARNASLQAELAAKSNELQLAGEEYANLEALTRSASDEQAASEEQLLVQITQLQHENQELRGVRGACEILEQSVANLKQRLSAEEAMKAELTEKLRSSISIPADLQQQLQHAQQQNQTLAHILAKECAQAAAHVENQHQLQAVWQQLVTAQHLPSNASVQEQAALLAQMLMHPQPQLVLSGSALHQQQQQQQPICQSAATCSSGLVPLPSFAVPNDNITQSPTVLQADLRPPHSSMGAVSVLSPGVAALGPSSTTSLQMLATTGNWGSEATPSASQHNVLLQPVSVNSTLKPPQRTSLTMSSPSVDPSCSPGQHDSVMQPMLGGPSSSPAQDLARDPSRSPMLSPSQRLSLQPVIGSPSLDPRQRLYVAQRVKELQSHAGSPLSPERSASSSSMLAAMLSPRSGDRRGGSASPKADHASQIAAPASPHHSVHPPTVLSSPSRGMHSRPDRPHAASTHGSNSNRHDTTTRHADVADRATFNRSDSAAGSSSGQLTATPAARDGSFGTQPVEQSQRSATGGDFKQGVESDMMHESSPGYELPPDAMPVAEAEDGRRADRLETSSGAVELQYDDDTDSAVSSQEGSGHADAERSDRAGPSSETSAQFGPEASVLLLSGNSQQAEDADPVSETIIPASAISSKPNNNMGSSRPPTLKQQLSDLHSSFKQMRSRFTPPQSRQLSRQSSASGL